jgi:Mg2+ and Co2+ transporter CorA
VRSVADGESHFLFGVIELYQTKVNTKMTVAMERLAVIAAVTLPITAIASIEGMNVIVAVRENFIELTVVLAIMAVMASGCCAGPQAGLVVRADEPRSRPQRYSGFS